MKIVVIGGTGALGSEVVAKLREDRQEAVPASPRSGVDTVTGEGLEEALAGAEVVVDAANAPAWGDEEVLEFFRASSGNLAAAAARAAVRHYVSMSIVGADRLSDSGYLRAKVAQEEVVRGAGLPYTIVRATQFFEFIRRIADSAGPDGPIHLPPALFQPAAVAELGTYVAAVAAAAPVDGVVEVGGPEPLRMDRAVARVLAAAGDPREVLADPHARYFGTELGDESLLPGGGAHLTATSFDEWLGRR